MPSIQNIHPITHTTHASHIHSKKKKLLNDKCYFLLVLYLSGGIQFECEPCNRIYSLFLLITHPIYRIFQLVNALYTSIGLLLNRKIKTQQRNRERGTFELSKSVIEIYKHLTNLFFFFRWNERRDNFQSEMSPIIDMYREEFPIFELLHFGFERKI